MFGIGLPEIALIAFIGVCVFGPDKLPELARQAAQVIRSVKGFADGARDELRDQLGPEFSDLELTDLDPRAIVRRHVAAALEDDEDRDLAEHDDRERPEGPDSETTDADVADAAAPEPVSLRDAS